MVKQATGTIIYRGPSMLDGASIVAVLTYRSRNVKTGPMAQLWVIRDDIHPLDARETGADASICGDCRHRGGSCYVNIGQAPASVFRGVERGIYPVASDIAGEGAGRIIRLGAYGDPAAVPVDIIAALLSRAAAWTGYSHQWQDPRFAPLARWCMASVDTPEEYWQAIAAGWRAFRVRTGTQALAAGEIVCPASDEGGKRTQCAACRLCGGNSKAAAKSIAIVAHGKGAKRFAAIVDA